MRGTDPRAAALLDEVDAMPDDLWERLHGTVRYLDSMTAPARPTPDADPPGRRTCRGGTRARTASVDPENDAVLIGEVEVRRGSRVLLRPGVRRADAYDLFLAGRTATVAAVCTTSTTVSTWPSPSTTTRAPTSRPRTGATSTSRPTRSSRSPPGEARPADDRACSSPASATSSSATTASASRSPPGLAGRELPDEVRVEDFGIRSVHLVYELLDGYDVLVLVDTVAQQEGPPGTLYVIEPDLPAPAARRRPAAARSMLDAHDLSPGGVMALVPTLGGSVDRILVVGCQPDTLEDGIGLHRRGRGRGGACGRPGRWTSRPARSASAGAHDTPEEEEAMKKLFRPGRGLAALGAPCWRPCPTSSATSRCAGCDAAAGAAAESTGPRIAGTRGWPDAGSPWARRGLGAAPAVRRPRGRRRPVIGVRLPCSRVVGEPDQVGQRALERLRELGQLAHVQAGAVLEARQRLVRGRHPDASQPGHHLLLGQPQLAASVAEPLADHQVPVGAQLVVRRTGVIRPVTRLLTSLLPSCRRAGARCSARS